MKIRPSLKSDRPLPLGLMEALTSIESEAVIHCPRFQPGLEQLRQKTVGNLADDDEGKAHVIRQSQ